MLDKRTFFDGVRGKVTLTNANVPGFDAVLDYAGKRGTDLERLAYILATAYHETAATMQPVREAFWLSETWRKQHLRYWPYYGRGYIQTTWKQNYLAIGNALGVGGLFVNEPDRLLEVKWALPALFVGMEQGLYTGVKLADAIDGIDESDTEDFREYVAARRIVNGSDKASSIANLALTFEHALAAAHYTATA